MHRVKKLVCRIILIKIYFLLSTTISYPSTVPTNEQSLPGWWPQPYSVTRKDTKGAILLSTPYYTIQHDLKKGGAITEIKYTYGKEANLLVRPIETSVQAEDGNNIILFSDIYNSAAKVFHTKADKSEVVTVEGTLMDKDGKDSGINVKTKYEYHWGYIRVHKEFFFPYQKNVQNITVLSTVLAQSLNSFGYRPGIGEGVIGSNFPIKWGKMRAGTHLDQPLMVHYIPLYLVFANQGVEGIEWFLSDDLAQWNYQFTTQSTVGFCHILPKLDPLGVAVSICPLNLSPLNLIKRTISVKGNYSFDYYIGMPILEDHAVEPMFHKLFSREKNMWTAEDEIRRWANRGINVASFAGSVPFDDPLQWKCGVYPAPYPPEEIKNLLRVIETCHSYGIKVLKALPTKHLHPITDEFKKHGEEWGMKFEDNGQLLHDYYDFKQKNGEFGTVMCLKSGWLDLLKTQIDGMINNYKFDGMYYDWCLGVFCNNPIHISNGTSKDSKDKGLGVLGIFPYSHWDIDELIELVEWTRQRVGPNGLIVIHNTGVPMFTLENFANHMLTLEWGYGQVLSSFPHISELPLEWNFAGARSRGIIPVSVVNQKAPKRLNQLMALSALMTSVTIEDWADLGCEPEELKPFKILKLLGDFKEYRFEDWRNKATILSDDTCVSAIYSKPDEAYIMLANFTSESKKIICKINLKNLPYPLFSISKGTIIIKDKTISLNINKLTGSGEDITIPADSVVLLHVL